MKRISTFPWTMAAAAIFGALTAAGGVSAAELVVTSNEPIPYRGDARGAGRAAPHIDYMYPRGGGRVVFLSPRHLRDDELPYSRTPRFIQRDYLELQIADSPGGEAVRANPR